MLFVHLYVCILFVYLYSVSATILLRQCHYDQKQCFTNHYHWFRWPVSRRAWITRHWDVKPSWRWWRWWWCQLESWDMQSSSQITTVNIPALSFYRPDVLTDSEPSVKALKANCFYSTSTTTAAATSPCLKKVGHLFFR